MTNVQPRLQTALVGRYSLERELGVGGMATVFQALDVRHKRRVALKVIREDFAAGMGAERFLREIELAAGLHHPNILPLYDSGSADGILYYTMPLAEGESLRNRLDRDRAIPLAEALRLTREVADALDYAHRHEVVHRDIKPENILLHEGHALITDFGIGKALSAATAGETLTQIGLAVGTPAYMSPEQASGETHLDGRTDLYSLGCVLYEMLTGTLPFTGATAAAVIVKRLVEPPPDPRAKSSDVPTAVADVTLRLMATDPANRFSTGAEVSHALAAGSTSLPNVTAVRAGSPSTVPWIAVLPFATNGRDPEMTDFAEGLVDEITTGLAQFAHLKVVARQSAQRASESGGDLRRVGDALGARFVIEGNIRKSGSSIRVGAQLIDASTGTTLWAETYDRGLTGERIFAVQDDLADRIVATVADPYGVLVRSMAAPLRDRPVEELTGLELVLLLFAITYQLHPEDHARLRRGLEHAVKREPDNAEVWASLAEVYWYEEMHGINSQADALGRARRAAQRALECDPASHFATYELALVTYFSGDLAGFRPLAERCLTMNPRNTAMGAMIAVLITYGGDAARGNELMRRLMSLNPNHAGWYHFVPFNYHCDRGNYSEALASAKRINMPELVWNHCSIALASAELGMWEEAQAAVQTVRQRFPWALDPETSSKLFAWYRDPDMAERRATSLNKAVSGPPRPSEPSKSIAVLPFANMSGNEDDEYFSDGISEEIINALAQIDGLKVAARTSAFSFKGKNEDLRVVGEKLGVATVLEGSIRRSGQRLRITAQLINVTDGYHLWSERYDREITDIFAVQDEIAASIAAKLKVTLGHAESKTSPPTSSIEAYELFLKGRNYLLQRGQALRPAIECLERAMSLDPRYAAPQAALGEAYAMLGHYGIADPRTVMPRANDLLEGAIRLDPASAEAHSALALVTLVWNRDRETAESLWKRALSLNPLLAQARVVYGTWYLAMTRGRFEEAEVEIEQAAALDPLNPYVLATRALCDWVSQHPSRISRSVVEAHRAVELDPNAYLGRWVLQMAFNAARRWDDAIAAGEIALAMSNRHAWALGGMVISLVGAGRNDDARRIYEEMLDRSEKQYMQLSLIASAAFYLGDFDDGMKLLWQGVERRETNLASILPNYPFLGLPKDRPERAKLLAALGWG